MRVINNTAAEKDSRVGGLVVVGELMVKDRPVGVAPRAQFIVIDLFVGDRMSPKGIAPPSVYILENEQDDVQALPE